MRKRYSVSEKTTVRKLFRLGKKDDEIAEEISKTRPGTNPKAIQTVRSKWGYVGHRRKKRFKPHQQFSAVIVRIGKAEFHTDKNIARTILEILAGI